MDYGDDPLVSSMYASEHARAVEALQPRKSSMLRALAQRREWKDQSLQDLRDKMVTPDMLVASGAKWGALQGKYGTQALIGFGFRWSSMLASGFRGVHLSTLSYEQVSLLGLTAHRMLECRPCARDVSSLMLRADQLHELGWTVQHLSAIGLDMANMVDFGFPATTWRDTLGVTDFRALGFSNYAQCARMGWRAADIELALHVPSAASAPSAAQARKTEGKIRFV